jgi:HEPN domain-containing protein/predicted nucleotidyltransferase
MLTTLDAIVRRVVEGCDPERVILFGSHATGRAREGSDYDLLIIKDDDRRPLDRRLDLERLLADRRVPIDLVVYTPREMWELLWAGSPFIEEVLESGKVLYMRNATEAWLREAADELDIASILLEHDRYRGACLHSQQAAEKALKALLIERVQRPPRTHDLVELLNTVRATGDIVSLTTDDAVFLTGVYRGRYPTDEGLLPHGEPTAQDARRAVDAARQVLDGARLAAAKGLAANEGRTEGGAAKPGGAASDDPEREG